MAGSPSGGPGFSQSQGGPGPLRDWEIRAWLEWCTRRRSERTCRGYASYLQRPLDPGNSWSVKAYRLLYAWRGLEPPAELRVPRARADLAVPSEGEVRLTLYRACTLDPRLCLVYRLLLESGARLVEVVEMLRGYDPSRDAEQPGWLEYRLDWRRGRKRALILFHTTRPRIPFDNTPSWATQQAIRNGLVRPKYMRKFAATKMLELEIPRDAVNFIQGRAGEDVLARHYLDRLVLARRHYPRYAEWVAQLYEELGLPQPQPAVHA